MPQHRRGTAIKPSQDALAQEQPKKKKRQKLDKLVVDPQSSTANDDLSNPYDAVSGSPANEYSLNTDAVKQTGAGDNDERLAESTTDPRTEDVETDARNSVKDGTITSPIGTLGPQKRKRKKPTTHSSKDKDILEAQAKQSNFQIEAPPVMECVAEADSDADADAATGNDVEENSITVDSIGKAGARRRKENKRSVLPPLQDHALDSDIAELAATDNDPPSTVAAARVSLSKDGMVVNPIGKPGPPRRKKQKTTPLESPPNGAPDAEAPESPAQPQRVHSDGVGKSLAGRPGQPEQKKRNQKQATTGPEPKRPEASQTSQWQAPDAENLDEDLDMAVDEDEGVYVIDVSHPSKSKGPKKSRQKKRQAPPADRIPTPPVSPSDDEDDAQGADRTEVDAGDEHDPNYDPNDRENYVDPSDQIATWMDSQESPAPPDRAKRAQGSSIMKTSAPNWKRTAKVWENAHDEDHDDEQAEEESEFDPEQQKSNQKKSTPKRKTSAKERIKTEMQPTDGERGSVNGLWTTAEKKIADDVFNRVCLQDSVEPWELHASIKDWANADSFKNEINEAFPRRTTTAIRKFAQRRFTSFERGPWTEEQDEALRRAYAAEPDRWTTISDYTGRAPEACRDRWRNVLKYGGTMETGPWSREEEEKLIRAVGDCMDVVQENCKDEEARNDLDHLESMIEWNTVAEKMEGKRSKKRCHDKFQKLKIRRDSYKKTQEDGGRDLNAPQFPTGLGEDQQSKKLKSIETAYRQFKPGDVYRVLAEIVEAIADPKVVYHDESTVWSIVSVKHPSSKFKSALRRRAYYDAVETYSSKKVKRATTIAAKAKAVWKGMTKLARKGELVLAEGYQIDGPETPRKAVSSRKLNKSAKMVPESDDDAEVGAEDEDEVVVSQRGDEVADDQDEPDDVGDDQYEPDEVDDDQHEPDEVDEDQDEAEKPEEDGPDEAPETELPREPGMAEEDGALDEGLDGMEDVEDAPSSSASGRHVQSLSSESPGLSQAEFIARCKADKKRQRREKKTKR